MPPNVLETTIFSLGNWGMAFPESRFGHLEFSGGLGFRVLGGFGFWVLGGLGFTV